MLKLLLSAAALAAITLPAAAETTGSVGISLTNNEYDSGFDYDTWQLEGSVFHRVAGPWAVQVEGRYEEVDYSFFEDEGQHIAIHGLWASDTFTLGAFAGQGEVFSDIDFYGAEGAYRAENWTFTGSMILSELGSSTDYDRYRLGAKYFFGDNLLVGGGIAWTELGSSDWETYDLGAEYRLGTLPITLTGGYLSQTGDFIEVDAWTIGARWDFGGATLRDSDRTAPIADVDNFFGDLRRWD